MVSGQSMANFPNTFAAGWNARCGNKPFEKKASGDWQDGWKFANDCEPRGRVPFNRSRSI
jgi:hypothetical protein